jgi:hypothetical protein
VKNIDKTEISDLSCKVCLSEYFLYFIYHYISIINEAILLHEKNSVTSVDLLVVILGLKDKIENRMNNSFFGAEVMKIISALRPNEQAMFKKKKKLIKFTKKLLIILKNITISTIQIFRFFQTLI